MSNTASCVFYDITCLIRLIEFTELFAIVEESLCYTSSVRQVAPPEAPADAVVQPLVREVALRDAALQDGDRDVGQRGCDEDGDQHLGRPGRVRVAQRRQPRMEDLPRALLHPQPVEEADGAPLGPLALRGHGPRPLGRGSAAMRGPERVEGRHGPGPVDAAQPLLEEVVVRPVPKEGVRLAERLSVEAEEDALDEADEDQALAHCLQRGLQEEFAVAVDLDGARLRDVELLELPPDLPVRIPPVGGEDQAHHPAQRPQGARAAPAPILLAPLSASRARAAAA